MERRAPIAAAIRAGNSAKTPERPVPFKIYYVPGFLAGPLSGWPRHFERIQKMGFREICIAPVGAPAPSGDIFLAGDVDRADARLGEFKTADSLINKLTNAAAKHGLATLLDVVLDRVAADGDMARAHPELFSPPAGGSAVLDPRASLADANGAIARFDDKEAVRILARQWSDRLVAWKRSGATGFRLLGLERAPADFVADLVATVRKQVGDCRFVGWTPAVSWDQITALGEADLDGVFASTPWWDGRASWYADEHEILRRVAPIIGPVEVPFGPRLAQRTYAESHLPLLYRQALQIAAATGDGLLVPMGFEFMSRRPLDARFPTPEEWQETNLSLESDIASANRLIDRPANELRDEMGRLTGPGARLTALQMTNRRTAVLINTDLADSRPIQLPLDADDADADLAAGEVRIVPLRHELPILENGRNRKSAVRAATKAPRIVVENLTPRVEGGPFAAKRIVGQKITVEADAYIDGHDVLGAELLWKATDSDEWQRAPMSPTGNDRWQATFTPFRIGRWLFTVEAWLDDYATLCRSIRLKREAGVDIDVELAEVRLALEAAIARKACARTELADTLAILAGGDMEASVQALISPSTAKIVADSGAHAFAVQHEPIPLDVDRRQAGFASWYELFPRSQTDDPSRHGTFADVIERLPRIRDMGFDVLYFPPIHPIGVTARKGRNNSLVASPQDVGSPYAIGGREGGHDALHPALGTFEDFHRLIAAARDCGLEIALDFAIQCSPDHPWLREHPEWFRHRPDGTIKYAENPPKKYEDIVNVDFYADGAVPALWEALRDVVLFWIGEGVHTFRVDNPHTKPLAFWQWLIADVRGRHPDAIFLSEAFTRPKMMYRLAKVGFTQSYTYFTWRNSKQELMDYMRELTTTAVAEFFRPNFFVNTPDINPFFLQSSGRSGFLIRAALAATLSGLWGVYSGFELCEAAALPGREEYLDSEKYAIRIRDFAAPGNIVAEITRLNRIRKANPALHSHLGLSFYNSSNDQVLAYGKALPSHEDVIFVVVSLDPHRPQETSFEIPLWEWNLPDNGTLQAEDLMNGRRFALHGKNQWLQLDPAVSPFAIWRLSPDLGGGT
jgi:starch synthase (maltosyl-transferring)